MSVAVKDLTNIQISEDGSTITVDFQAEPPGMPVKLVFKSEKMKSILQQLSGASDFADSKSNKGSQGVKYIATPAQYRAAPTDDREAVILSFVMTSGMMHSFALPTKDTLDLATKMTSAANKGKDKQSRH